MDISELNDRQREAVLQTEGPVMVMAGAGSGKTKVLTYRIAYLIEELNVNPYSILAVTFTNKAANEMKSRISRMINSNVNTNSMWISTFHSFCAKLLRYEINNLPPFNNHFVILDDDDSLKIIKEIVKVNELDSKPKDIKNAISSTKNGMNYYSKDPIFNNDFTFVNQKYDEYLRNNNLLDFDDLILRTIELFKKNPSILEKYQRKFNYILVDEFQDTNTLQYDLIFMLGARLHNIFVVGDDFQSIYSFRGAKIENINKFRKDFLETKLILLERNYRSTSKILNLANSIIDKNPNQIKKVMYTDNNEGQLPYYYKASSSYDEVTFVIDKIKGLLLDGYKYSDIAILYRANYVSRNFEDLLVRKQIPYRIYGGLSFFQRKEIKDVVAYLRVIANANDDFSFRRIINEPKRKIGNVLINKLENVAIENNHSLYSIIPYLEGSNQGITALKEFHSNIESIKAELEHIELKELVDRILHKMNYIDALKSDDDSYEDRIDNVKEFMSFLAESNEYYTGSNLEKLEATLSDLALRTDSDKAIDENTIKLATFHQVKGLEFKAVFMVALEEEIFPSARVFFPQEIEEERRICYVGLTRAKENLFLSTADSRFLFGQERHLMPSRFLKELDSNCFDSNIRKTSVTKSPKTTGLKVNLAKEVTKPALSNDTYNQGDKIEHKAFGVGVIVSVEDKMINVAFKVPYGIKRLQKNHPAIKKL